MTIDYFALLEQERRPWLEADDVKNKYHELARRAHPDHDINEAYRVLVDPKLRLQHLLKLEGVTASDDIPDELADLFMAIAPTLNKIDKQNAKQIDSLIARVKEFYERMLTEIRALDPSWRENLPQIDKAYRAISYLTRWLELLEERRFQLN